MRRELVTAGAALALHLAVLTMLRRAPPTTPAPATMPPADSIEFALESETVDLDGDKPVVAHAPGAVAIAEPLKQGRSPAESAGEARSAEGSAAEGSPAGPSEGTSVQIAGLSHAQLGLGGGPNPFAGNTFAPPPPPPPPPEPPPKLDTGFPRPKDATIGMGADGPVIRALEEATYGGIAPLHGSALFEVVVNGDGLVTELKLLRSRGGRGWEETREATLKALAGKKMALRGAPAAEFRIEVTSDMQLPSGASRRYAVPLDRGKISRSANVPDNGTPDTIESRTVGLFDLADIGAKPRRVVRARLVVN